MKILTQYGYDTETRQFFDPTKVETEEGFKQATVITPDGAGWHINNVANPDGGETIDLRWEGTTDLAGLPLMVAAELSIPGGSQGSHGSHGDGV